MGVWMFEGHGGFDENPKEYEIPHSFMIVVYAPMGATLTQKAVELIFNKLNSGQNIVRGDFVMRTSQALGGSTFMAPPKGQDIAVDLPGDYPMVLVGGKNRTLRQWFLNDAYFGMNSTGNVKIYKAPDYSDVRLSGPGGILDSIAQSDRPPYVVHLTACSAPGLVTNSFGNVVGGVGRSQHVMHSTGMMVDVK